jgi:hypothetical protein
VHPAAARFAGVLSPFVYNRNVTLVYTIRILTNFGCFFAQIVSYKWASRHFDIPSNDAKRYAVFPFSIYASMTPRGRFFFAKTLQML